MSGVTVNPARIREEHKPSEWLLKHIPAHLPDLALGQRWAKCFYSDGLRQDNRVPRKVSNREALQACILKSHPATNPDHFYFPVSMVSSALRLNCTVVGQAYFGIQVISLAVCTVSLADLTDWARLVPLNTMQ